MKKTIFNSKWVWVSNNEEWESFYKTGEFKSSPPCVFLYSFPEMAKQRFSTINYTDFENYLCNKKYNVSLWKYMKPFTPEDYFKHCLPIEYAGLAINNIDKYYADCTEFPENCIEAIKKAFAWIETSEGEEFWSNVWLFAKGVNGKLPEIKSKFCHHCGSKLK